MGDPVVASQFVEEESLEQSSDSMLLEEASEVESDVAMETMGQVKQHALSRLYKSSLSGNPSILDREFLRQHDDAKMYKAKKMWTSDDDLFGDQIPRLPPPFIANKVSGVSTTFQNCKSLSRLQNGFMLPYAMECDLISNVPVSQDIFTLGCSRPFCSVYFKSISTTPSTRFVFVYEPNYPESFYSENVGLSRPIDDLALVTDGFLTRPLSFNIRYQAQAPVGGVLGSGPFALETSASVGRRNPTFYVMIESADSTPTRPPLFAAAPPMEEMTF
eukprot:TRINITY_DN8312_c0_g1_i15.p1 TRINITY_DN8312_c0_g1~~TRINITY_DN8312_c0_g1_i15.p1  ORF type:complete len:283 (-),score=96.54 TRINITY_DN8312_c0_g1_i15:42-863(-)